ncbi:MAG: cob(I)yrinic acid a,c-diamide adenosyltransferase [Phycisphaerales bacterium]|nr:cob(I)yrinic acid a,c-diamide adenosyltransferase [Phycisphaerales bacterium]
MKLYTKSGDDGTTGLFSGARVSKDHPRIESYGTIDEFNATLGMCSAVCDVGNALHQRLLEIFARLQIRMFDIGADLATPEGANNESKIQRIGQEHVQEVENWIDEIDGANAPLTAFVMPGGTELASRLHLARTICRRAERQMIHLSHSEPVGAALIMYVNRVSDFLFAAARLVNKDSGVKDVVWIAAVSRK